MSAFEFKIDLKDLADAVTPPNVEVGVLKADPLKSYKKETRQIAGITVNKKTRENFGDETTASSLMSVIKKTDILKFFEKLLNEKGGPLLLEALDEKKYKQVGNSFAALLKQAYLNMSNSRRNSEKRVKQKGFDQYAIGTGQTLEAISGLCKKNS